MWGAIIPAAISAVAALRGAKDTNSAQDERQQQSQEFNAHEAQLNRDFQERLSNSAYQRAMTDMKTAGLNPILAYNQGGASTPVGNSATSPQPAPVINKAAAAGDAAARTMSSAVQVAQLENVNANTDKAKAEASYTRTQEEVARADFKDPQDVGPGQGKTYTAERTRQEAQAKAHEVNWILSRDQLSISEKALVDQNIKNARLTGEKIKADTGNVAADTVLKQAAAAEAKSSEAFWKSLGEGGGAAQGLKFLAPILHSARSIFR